MFDVAGAAMSTGGSFAGGPRPGRSFVVVRRVVSSPSPLLRVSSHQVAGVGPAAGHADAGRSSVRSQQTTHRQR